MPANQNSLTAMTEDYLAFTDDNALFVEIGQRASMAPADPAAAISATLDYPHLSFGEDMKKLGRRIARRTARELHDVLCGADADDQQDRDKLKAAIDYSDQALAAVVAALLAGPLGLGGAIAAALAALFVKRLFKPTLEETCEFWNEKLRDM